MINIASWLEIFSGRLEANFPGRIWFMGLQGSYARYEALRRAVKIGACNTYHACVHNFLHYDKGFDDLSGKLFAWIGRKILESKSVR